MTLRLREEDQSPDGATLVIHGGEGKIEYALTAAIENYQDYRVLRDDGLGYFAVSVFATIHGVDERAIVDRLVHRSYGTTTVAMLRDPFKLIPTSDDNESLAPEIQWLQAVHFDICLPDPPDERLTQLDPVDDPTLSEPCMAFLAPHVEVLLGLFTRRRKA